MIDIHCHILPGIDDGPSDIEESVEMARMAARDGITKIVATPHLKQEVYHSAEITIRVRQLNSRLKKDNIPVTILPGADVFALLDPRLLFEFSINHTNYILIEFPHSHLPKTAKEILYRLVINGFRPIITHPERNPSILRNPDLLFHLLDGNSFVQITAGSLTGGFGRNEQECARYLLKKGVVDFIASDAHGVEYRPPVLSHALEAAAKIIGRKEAEKLVFANPEAVVEGKRLEVRG